MARPKRLEFSVTVDGEGRCLRAEDDESLALPAHWTPEHLVLAALARCSLKSLVHHAKRAGMEVLGTAAASGVVTKRAEDGRYAFVEVLCGLDVEVRPPPPPEGLPALLARAERDCFVSASLVARTEYEWRVNGAVVTRAAALR